MGQIKRQILASVLERYRQAAGGEPEGTCSPGCCGGGGRGVELSKDLGYSETDLASAPQGSNLGLGCGNPHAVAGLRPGETVLDLGCGGGFDCFLAAKQVGADGLIIGVDMTPEMIARARENAEKMEAPNVSFRLGEIEHLPVADAGVDVIISNCVINLAADKGAVYAEAFRVLRPGGRLAISDVVALAELPGDMVSDLELWASCAAGALTVSETERLLAEAGFEQVQVEPNPASREMIEKWLPGHGVEDYLAAASITAIKPGSKPSRAFGCC
ncbi:MAG: arsenite methyltransferase [Desulfarculaceae bacterium]|nr:arsenite methyltransferase [Desulfarculaceae bacterium]MCF8071581.1 arsenite methyltransferase [Desulfarculaceae bacterium]MCF8102396.1 arsenite methyltransferase [Desulfarculaceae bacterium]MCF8114860.1 arsenite methyltransferase [Desulfarculaceae bacterium]